MQFMQYTSSILRRSFHVSLSAKIYFANVNFAKIAFAFFSITFADVIAPRKLTINIYGAVHEF